MSGHDRYQSPLVTRNASDAMCRLFGARQRICTWRRLWLTLAKTQQSLGLSISNEQIDALESTLDDVDFDVAATYEKKLRHDVMAHIYAWGDKAPEARGILHMGTTSAFIVDNADLVIMRKAMWRVANCLAAIIDALGHFADDHKTRATLGFTHYQPAQITTVGKRAALWCWDFVRDLEELESRIAALRFRGVKGTTGTQASFLQLFDGDHDKVEKLDRLLAEAFQFEHIEPITGQTYSRKVDAQIITTLGQIAVSVHKFANDMRLLANLKEMEEPFESSQIGSSAMPYKRNPMRCERATGLARFVLSLIQSPYQTAAEQWFERTLDDSANKRLSIPEAFLATDGMLRIVLNVTKGLVVHPKVIERRLNAELPFMASEEILMAGTTAGGDRQELHEKIRTHALAAGNRVKRDGLDNDLIERLKNDSAFKGVDFAQVLDARRFIGRCPEQVRAFIAKHVDPIRKRFPDLQNLESTLSV